MEEIKAFDREARHYDALFTDTSVGKAQRAQVYHALEKDGLFSGRRVLEINCGTGADALEFHKRGNTILATDISPGMLETAGERFPEGEFVQLDMRAIGTLDGNFDLIFSNFGGVNCLSPEELQAFIGNCSAKLSPEGFLVLVIMGKRCWWDNVYLLLKGRFSQLGRRNTTKAINVPVADTVVATWYHAPREVKRMAEKHFHSVRQVPVGLWVPPSYMAPFFERKKDFSSF